MAGSAWRLGLAAPRCWPGWRASRCSCSKPRCGRRGSTSRVGGVALRWCCWRSAGGACADAARLGAARARRCALGFGAPAGARRMRLADTLAAGARRPRRAASPASSRACRSVGADGAALSLRGRDGAAVDAAVQRAAAASRSAGTAACHDDGSLAAAAPSCAPASAGASAAPAPAARQPEPARLRLRAVAVRAGHRARPATCAHAPAHADAARRDAPATRSNALRQRVRDAIDAAAWPTARRRRAGRAGGRRPGARSSATTGSCSATPASRT